MYSESEKKKQPVSAASSVPSGSVGCSKRQRRTVRLSMVSARLMKLVASVAEAVTN